jgi:hypothetical protein
MTVDQIIKEISVMKNQDISILKTFINSKNYVTVRERNKQYIINKITKMTDYLVSEKGIDLLKKSRKTEHTFPRFSFIAIIKDRYLTDSKGWSILGRILEKNHATIWHCYNVHLQEIESNNEDYLAVYNKIETFINEFELIYVA